MAKKLSTLEALLQVIISQSVAAITEAVRDHASATRAATLQRAARKAPSPVSPKKPATSSPKAATPKPRAGAITENHVELLLDAITAFPGLRANQLHEKVGLPIDQVKAALEKLRDAKRVRVAGKTRWTTYSLIGSGTAKASRKADRKPAAKAKQTRNASASVSSKPVASPPAVAALAPKKRAWPTCTTAGCSNKYFPASGKARLCYQHFLAAGGTPPLAKRK